MTMKTRLAFHSSSCAMALLVSGMAYAQESGTANPADEPNAETEIIVTAQKRSERLSDVPIAITAASGDQLVKQGIDSPAMLERIAPGLTFQQTHFGTPVFTIRGVGFFDTSIGSSPTVSIYLDQAPLPYSIMTRGISLDLERVEVLKGPQGTLFGQSSTGGAVNYIAAKPTEETHAGFLLNAGRFNEVSAEAFVSGKLSDTVTARVAGRYEYRDGWQKPDLRNDARFGQSADNRMAKRRFYTGRFLLDWQPSDTLKFEFGANAWHDGSEPQASHFIQFSPVVAPNPFNAPVYAAYAPLVGTPNNPRLAGWDVGRDFGTDDDFYQLSLRGDLEITDDVTLSSITAYSKYRGQTELDPDGTGYSDFVLQRDGRIDSFFQELRLAGEVNDLKWLVGANYAWDHSNEIQQNLLGVTNTSIGPFQFNSTQVRNDQKARTYAAFGSLTYALSSQLEVQGSIRYTKQDRDFQGCLADPGNGQIATAIGLAFSVPTQAGACITQAAPGVLLDRVNSSLNEDNVSFRTILNWHPDRDTLLYASISRGYKPGSYPVLPAVFGFQFDPVTQESVTSYEGGFKIALLDRRVSLDGAFFYADYKDKQILGSAVIPPFGNLPKLVNIPKARVYGGELQATLRPIDGLRVTAGGAYYSTRVQEDPSNPVDAFGLPTSFVGAELPTTPKWQLVGDAEYGFNLGSSSRLFVGGSMTYRHSTFAAFGENPELLLPGYTLFDIRGGLEAPDGRWRAQLWGRNITNKFYYYSKQHGADSVAGIVGMPATYGITVSYRY